MSSKGKKSNITYIFGLVVTVLGSACFTFTLRKIFAGILKFFGKIGLVLFPSIYRRMDDFNEENSSSLRVKEKYQDKARIRSFLKEAEKQKLCKDEILKELDKLVIHKDDREFSFEEIFEYADRNNEVAIQYSGGCDSTLIALMSAMYFKKVHLLTFSHSLIAGANRSDANANKLISYFGTDKIVYKRINTTEVFKEFLYGDYNEDLKKYGTFITGVGCLACKMSFDVNIIKYALNNNVAYILDGADLSVKTQLSQGNKEILNERLKLYNKYGIGFMHPAVKFKNNTYLMVKMGLDLDPNMILYAEQPECKGNQFLNEIHDRFYFIPKYGVEAHTQKALEWYKDKLPICLKFIGAKAVVTKKDKT